MTDDDRTASTESKFPPERVGAVKHLLARGPLCTRMVDWVMSQLEMDTSDNRHALELWQTHWRARAIGAIHEFLSGISKSDLDTIGFAALHDAFVASVKTWTGGAVTPHRILKLDATRWTPLERVFVAHWSYVQHTRKQSRIAWNRRVPSQEIEDVIHDFWIQVFHSPDTGPLRGYVHDPKAPLSPEDQYRVYLTKCFVHYCIRRAVRFAAEGARVDEFDETRFSTTRVGSLAGFETRGDPRALEAQLQELMDTCDPKLTLMERMVFERRLFGDTAEEIAKRLDTEPGAVRVRLHRARNKLRAFVGKRFVDELAAWQEAGHGL